MTTVAKLDDAAHCETFLTVRQLARLLNVPVGTIYEWNTVGSGPAYYRIGRFVRYAQSDVDDWLARRRHERRAS